MASVVNKRLSLHKTLAQQHDENAELRRWNNQLQSLANIGSATCMIAHEINNLLTPMANYAALALKDPDDRSLTSKALEKTVRNCERASKIMESILSLANGRQQQREQVRLLVLVEEVFACLCRDFAKDGITVRLNIPENLMIRVVPVQIQQVMMNLILNARDAMLQRGGILTITASEDTQAAVIEVADTGAGIAPESLRRIFETFYTTKRSPDFSGPHSGSGVGLAFCKRIVTEHGGSISVESTPDIGTTFRVVLPKA